MDHQTMLHPRHSSVAVDSSLLGCDAVSMGQWTPAVSRAFIVKPKHSEKDENLHMKAS
jgi:hypothetical protein